MKGFPVYGSRFPEGRPAHILSASDEHDAPSGTRTSKSISGNRQPGTGNPIRSGVTILAGGTGGHIFPGLAVAGALITGGVNVCWLGTPHGLENRLVPRAGIQLDRIGIQGLRGRGMAGWLAAPLRVLRAILQTRRVFARQRPACVLSMGGYVAGPGGVAAWLMGIPLVVHEQNSIPGWTNRLLAPLAAKVFTGFPGVLRRAEFSGNPVRAEIASLAPPESRAAERRGRLRMLVIGGSQGASIFNKIVPKALARVSADLRPEVLHQAGKQKLQAEQNYEEAGIQAEITDFVDDMAGAWAGADFALCRSGALTVAELAAAGVPAILVPYPHAVDDHQTANARYLADAGAAWLMPESEFNPEALAARLGAMTRGRLLTMAVKARALARPEAAALVARGCLEVMR